MDEDQPLGDGSEIPVRLQTSDGGRGRTAAHGRFDRYRCSRHRTNIGRILPATPLASQSEISLLSTPSSRWRRRTSPVLPRGVCPGLLSDHSLARGAAPAPVRPQPGHAGQGGRWCLERPPLVVRQRGGKSCTGRCPGRGQVAVPLGPPRPERHRQHQVIVRALTPRLVAVMPFGHLDRHPEVSTSWTSIAASGSAATPASVQPSRLKPFTARLPFNTAWSWTSSAHHG
jgi:hypothetical protein